MQEEEEEEKKVEWRRGGSKRGVEQEVSFFVFFSCSNFDHVTFVCYCFVIMDRFIRHC